MNFIALAEAPSIDISQTIRDLWAESGLYDIFHNFLDSGWQTLAMIFIACVLLYLAIGKNLSHYCCCLSQQAFCWLMSAAERFLTVSALPMDMSTGNALTVLAL